DLWLGTTTGLYRLHNESLDHYGTVDGLPGQGISALVLDAHDTLWVGTRHGLAKRAGQRFVTDSAWGDLASDHVRSFHLQADGTLWVGTFDDGIVRLKGGRASRLTTRDGLFANGAFQILEDDRGQFWISCNRGIYRVRRRKLNDFADRRSRVVNTVAYGARDGMRSVEANGGRQPAGVRLRDGRLVFPTQDGIVVIDPTAVPFNEYAPP